MIQKLKKLTGGRSLVFCAMFSVFLILTLSIYVACELTSSDDCDSTCTDAGYRANNLVYTDQTHCSAAGFTWVDGCCCEPFDDDDEEED